MHFRISQSSESDVLGLGGGSNEHIPRPRGVEDCIGKMPPKSVLQEDLLVIAKTILAKDKGTDRSSTVGSSLVGAPATATFCPLGKIAPSSTITKASTAGQDIHDHPKFRTLPLNQQDNADKLSFPNRVSFTQEERRPLLNSPSPSSASSSDEAEAEQLPAVVGKDANSKHQSEDTPLEIAEILRQMSRATVPEKVLPRRVSTEIRKAPLSPQEKQQQKQLEEEDSVSAVAALTEIGKRKVPPSSPTVSKTSSTNPNKRIRWQAPTTHNFAPFLAAATAAMVPGMAAAAAVAAGLPYNMLLQQQQRHLSLMRMVPPARPIPGLNPYDVLFYGQMASHFHIGNRRLLILGANYLDKYFAGKPKVREAIINTIYCAHKSAGGRFLVLNQRSAAFDECPEATAKAILALVLRRQEEARRVMGNNLLHIFRAEGCFIWAPPNTAAAGGPDGFLQASETLAAAAASKQLHLSTLSQKGAATSPKEANLTPSRKMEGGRMSASGEGAGSAWSEQETTAPAKRVITPMTPLAEDFQPGPFDVICSRGSAARKHPGNLYFVGLIAANCDRYIKSDCKLAKSMIVTDMLDTIRRNSPNGGFVKLDGSGRWCETGDHLAREKIGQCFRDRLHTMYSSSSKAKLQKRRQKGLMLQSIVPDPTSTGTSTGTTFKTSAIITSPESPVEKVAPAASAAPGKD